MKLVGGLFLFQGRCRPPSAQEGFLEHRDSLGLRHRRIEKLADHRSQPLAALRKRRVSGAGEDGELRGWEARKIPHNAAAEQTEHFHGVLGADYVGIPDDEQGWRVYRLYGLGG